MEMEVGNPRSKEARVCAGHDCSGLKLELTEEEGNTNPQDSSLVDVSPVPFWAAPVQYSSDHKRGYEVASLLGIISDSVAWDASKSDLMP